MFSYRALRQMWTKHLEEANNNPARQGGHGDYWTGRLGALREFHDTLGLDTHPRSGLPMIPVNESGLPDLKPRRAPAREFSLRTLAEAIMGHEFVEEYYHPSGGFDFSGMSMGIAEAAIHPTAFIDINTFNLATAGLLQAEIMEGFNQPEFIGRNIVKIVPTRKNGDKLIGVARMGAVTSNAKGRQPGEAHAEVGFGQAYQTTPETVEQALKCRVTREAVFFDITDQVMDEARDGVGRELSYGQEKDIADCVLGVVNSYNRNGTSYNTYQTASPWINDHANPFSDETDIDDARQLFVGMTDPESGKEILVNAYTILCMPARELKFRDQLMKTAVQIGTQLNSNFPSRYAMTASQINTVGGGSYTLQPLSAIWYNRATSADGLNLSASAAKEYWWLGDFQRAFQWRENWPLTPWIAAANELVMKDQGLVMVAGANYRGKAYVREPRYVTRNKDS